MSHQTRSVMTTSAGAAWCGGTDRARAGHRPLDVRCDTWTRRHRPAAWHRVRGARLPGPRAT